MLWTLAIVLTAALPTTDAPPAANDDLAALQGVWERELKVQGQPVKIQKEIRGNRETLRTFVDGQLLHEHKVEFELSLADGIKIFRWKNGENTFGARKGKPMPDGAYIYRLKDQRWTTVYGFLPGQEDTPLNSEQFQRVGD